MAQTVTAVASKSTGDRLTATELNAINTTVNDNSADAEARIAALEASSQSGSGGDQQVSDGGYYVDSYEAVGDGVADDYLAIQSAIDAAGEGGTVVFTRGKTYLYNRSIAPLEGQTFIGYGATIKRGNTVASQIVSVDRTTDPSNPVVVVSDGSLFANDMGSDDHKQVLACITL